MKPEYDSDGKLVLLPMNSAGPVTTMANVVAMTPAVAAAARMFGIGT